MSNIFLNSLPDKWGVVHTLTFTLDMQYEILQRSDVDFPLRLNLRDI